MRILLIADYAANHSGAFGSSMIALAKRLRDDGDDVRFAFSGASSLAAHIGIEFKVEHGIIKPGSRWNQSLWDAVKRVTSGWVPDLVHVHFGQASLLVGLKARRMFRCKLIWHVRGFLRERDWLSGFFGATYYRFASGRTDSVVCISNAIATDLRNRGYVQPGKLCVIHNGIPRPVPGQAAPDKALVSDLKSRGVNLQRVIGMVANFGPEKDHETVLTGFSILRQSFPDSTMVLVGEGMQREKEQGAERISHLVDSLGLTGSVHLAGRVDPVWGAIAAFSIGLLISHSEGFGNVAAEYGIMGKPALVSSVGGLPEIVEDGKTGFLIPPGNSSLLADRLSFLFKNPDRMIAMGEAGKKRVSSLFSMNEWANKIVNHYSEVLSDA
jgi:glycosyltransferase involved in cell wall biosynthesis